MLITLLQLWGLELGADFPWLHRVEQRKTQLERRMIPDLSKSTLHRLTYFFTF